MLKVENLCTEYPNSKGEMVRATHGIGFDVPEGKFFTLLGPSGCGKTTTLRSVAGLERPVMGEVNVSGTTVFSSARGIFVPPHKRQFGMVFQSYAIWPHLSVYENAAFPLKVGSRRLGKKQIEEKVLRALTAVGLDGFAGQEATKMSGGQQQRLALARALVMEPRLLLLDEPLSNLDAKLRERMRFELKRMQRELGVTSIYVTHDQSEALALSHEIAVMNAGRIVQIAAPRDIYLKPANKFVADFVGVSTFIEAKAEEALAEPDGYQVGAAFGRIGVRSADTLSRGESVLVSVRPEDVRLSEHRPEGENVVEGKIHLKVFLGECIDYQVDLGGQKLLARSHPSFNVVVGTRVFVQLDSRKCVAFPDESTRRQAA
ncbi:ATP-binding cassette domain-containing protein [Bordetella petrii]|nr:ATP-binding cassette domain-containing protein [Bordetella petrii]